MSSSHLYRSTNHLITLLRVLFNDSRLNTYHLLVHTAHKIMNNNDFEINTIIVNNTKKYLTYLTKYDTKINSIKHTLTYVALGLNLSIYLVT